MNESLNDNNQRTVNERRPRKVALYRNSLNILSAFNIVLAFVWSFVRAFICWDERYCDPVEGLFSSGWCYVCQLDLLIVPLLVISSILLISMLVMLFRYEITDPEDSNIGKQESKWAWVRSSQSINASAKSMQKNGPGWWTAAFAFFAICVAGYYIVTENRSLWWIWS